MAVEDLNSTPWLAKVSTKNVEVLDSTSWLAKLYTRYWAIRCSLDNEWETHDIAWQNWAASQLHRERQRTRNDTSTIRNDGKTRDDIDALRAQNQEASGLLRLPNELLITIWSLASGSGRATRVHGISSRYALESTFASLIHSCSLLNNVLRPVFLEQDAFMFKASSSDSVQAATEMNKWWSQAPYMIVANCKRVRPLILLELKVGRLALEDAVKLAVEVQLICSTARTFQPRVLALIADTAVPYYGGPGLAMRLYPPPVGGTYEVLKATCSNNFIPPIADQHGLWKGWIATKVTEVPHGRENLPRLVRGRRVVQVDEISALCRSYTEK